MPGSVLGAQSSLGQYLPAGTLQVPLTGGVSFLSHLISIRGALLCLGATLGAGSKGCHDGCPSNRWGKRAQAVMRE